MPRRTIPALRGLRSAATGRSVMPTRSSRQALAALGAPAIEHADAAFGQHALAKAMAALADEPARLIGALHDTAPVPVAKKAPANLTVAVGKSPSFSRIAGLIRADRGQVNVCAVPLIH